jgi:D-threonate/D-erythronate kinase
LEQAGPIGIVVFGGDTAFHLLKALGVAGVWPCMEILSGVPLSRIEFRGQKMPFITKAGGFDAPGLIGEIRRRMEGML